MASFSKGTSFTDGVTGDVTAAKLHALVDAATPVAGLVTDRTAKTSVVGADLVLLSDSADSNNLKKVSVTNFANNLPTAVITNGTVTTLNSTTGTITGANITTGTIATGTFGTTTSTAATITTGTIPTLVSTTSITSGTGSASAPAIRPTGDTDTGLFFPAADTIAFAEGGTESMRIDSSGRVGIGATSLSKKLTVYSDNSTAYSSSDFDSARNLLVQNANTTTNANVGVQFLVGTNSEAAITAIRTGDGTADLAFGTRGGGSRTERLRIDSSGNVGIGKAPSYQLEVYRSGSNTSRVAASNDNIVTTIESSGTSLGFVGTLTNHPVGVITNNTERLRIDSDGDVSIGTATALSRLHVHGNITLSNTTTATSAGTGGLTLPASAAGYLTVSINGTSRKIPYYAT